MNGYIDYQKFARDLHNARWGRGMTGAQIAKELGVSKATISRWENAKLEISTARFMGVCLYFDFNPYRYLVVTGWTKQQSRIVTSDDQDLQSIFNAESCWTGEGKRPEVEQPAFAHRETSHVGKVPGWWNATGSYQD